MPQKNIDEIRKSARERKAKFRAAGLCQICGGGPLVTATMCAVHRDYFRKYQKARREKRVEAGICTNCCKEPKVNATMCETCRLKHGRYVAGVHSRREEAGMCKGGGKIEPETGRKRCGPCRKAFRAYRSKIRNIVYAAYGGYVCACCGVTGKAFVTLDHVNNDGARMRREVHGYGNWPTILWIRRNGFPDTIQVLCWNCQLGKYRNGGICPHKTGVQRPEK